MTRLSAFFLVAGIVAMASCKKEDPLTGVSDISGLGGDTWVPTAIDKWIYDSLTVPFNINVKYKWDQSELELNKTLVPPKEANIIPIMSSIKKVWLNTYVAEAGDLFVKKLAPKHLILVGSGNYNLDGTTTLGTAEGGRKVVLYQANYFKVKTDPTYQPSDSLLIKEMFHVIDHEFGHILNQNVMYPLEYKTITVALYTPTWFNYTTEEANNEGFISNYSMSNPDDDFVEMISLMLTNGKEGFESLIANINYTGTTPNGTTAPVAIARLRQKEAIVVNYFKEVWNIDFYSLQARTRVAIKEII